jgi:hypothetical protein
MTTLSKASIAEIKADMISNGSMLTDEQVNALAQKVNEAINLPLLNENAEFKVFAKIIKLIDSKLYDVLPNEYYELIHDANNGISETEAVVLEERLTKVLNGKINIPFISEQKEGMLLAIVVSQIVRGMVDGFKLQEKSIA